jgi:hypothetical protein
MRELGLSSRFQTDAERNSDFSSKAKEGYTSDVEQQSRMSKISSVYSTVLELPPSCIEFWPANPNCFVVGTYHLEKISEQTDDGRLQTAESDTDVNDTTGGDGKAMQQNRDGSIILFRLSDKVA